MAFTKVTNAGIGSTNTVLLHNLNVVGTVTATDGIFSGIGSFGGNVTVGGVLTYEDVTNVDSVGLITARKGISVLGAGVTIAGGGLNVNAGVSTLQATNVTSLDVSAGLGIAESLFHLGDTNTRFAFPSADTITAETGGTERVRVNSTGQVLINTTDGTAAHQLVVSAPNNSDTGIAFRGGTSSQQYIKFSDGTSGGAENIGEIEYNHATNSLAIDVNGSERIRIISDGKVGIGTAVPDQNLEIHQQSGTNLVKLSTHANSTIGLEIEKTGATTQSWRIADGQTSNGSLEFYDVTDSATRLLINGSGKIGIGENSPDEILHINSGTSNGCLKLESTDSQADLYIVDSGGQVAISASGDNLLFQNTGSQTERFRITSTGQLQATSAADIRLTLGSSGTAGTNDSVHVRADSANLCFMAASGGTTKFEANGTETLSISSAGLMTQTGQTRISQSSTHSHGLNAGTVLEVRGDSIGSGVVDVDYFKAFKIALNDQTEWGGQAQFSVGRWTESGNNARSTLMVSLAHGQINSGSNADKDIFMCRSDGYFLVTGDGSWGAGYQTEGVSLRSHGDSTFVRTSSPAITITRKTDAGKVLDFYNDTQYAGGIYVNGNGNTAIQQTSDYRLKTDVSSMTDGITKVKLLNPIYFKNNTGFDTTTTQNGFLAHEIQSVLPTLVDGEKDGPIDEKGKGYQTMDYAGLTPTLTAAVKELIAKVETLETEVAALKSS